MDFGVRPKREIALDVSCLLSIHPVFDRHERYLGFRVYSRLHFMLYRERDAPSLRRGSLFRSSAHSRRKSRYTPCHPSRPASPTLSHSATRRTRRLGYSLVRIAASAPRPRHESPPISCTRLPQPATSIPATAPECPPQTPTSVPTTPIATQHATSTIPSHPAALAGARSRSTPKPSQLYCPCRQPGAGRECTTPGVSFAFSFVYLASQCEPSSLSLGESGLACSRIS